MVYKEQKLEFLDLDMFSQSGAKPPLGPGYYSLNSMNSVASLNSLNMSGRQGYSPSPIPGGPASGQAASQVGNQHKQLHSTPLTFSRLTGLYL